MNLTKVNRKIFISGCRIHDEDSQCTGKLIKIKSKYGGLLQCCEGAFEKIKDKGWRRC